MLNGRDGKYILTRRVPAGTKAPVEMNGEDERHESFEIEGAQERGLSLPLGSRPGDDPSLSSSLLTSRSAAALGFLSADLIMTRLGVYEPMSTKELILRDENLVGFQEECAQSLLSLEILSLSHNKLTTLQGFQYLSNLIELNLNFNQISSLDNLQCYGLEKLFLSNNRIIDITPLKPFVKLNTISVYGNLIADLESSLATCRALPKLRSLDLGGNPCSQELEGYKFQVVRFLPRLKVLDGDQLTQLDKDLAEEYLIQGRTMPTDQLTRPSTATTIGCRPLTASKPWDPSATPPKAFDAFASEHMPKGNVRLFRDDFLNNNAILLEYLAQETQATARDHLLVDDTESADEPGSLVRSSSFVEKMRGANPLSDDLPSDDTAEMRTNSSRPSTARPTTAGLSTGIGAVLTSNLGIDPSDPKSTIRKLLKHIEVLEESLASFKTHQVEASEQVLLEENRRLQTENNNIPILQEEIASLKKQLCAAGPRPPVPTSIALGPEAKKLNQLELENEQLRRELARLQQMLKAQEIASSEPTSCNGKTAKSKRLSDSDLLEESASIDVELTELILQNEVSLEMIRNDIKNTKKEWEEQFQAAKERELERQRARPQTSLGLQHAPATKSREGKSGELGDIHRANYSASKVSSITAQLPGRQLYTSAGFRHGGGPEERLLHASSATRSSTSSSGRSVTNILTL